MEKGTQVSDDNSGLHIGILGGGEGHSIVEPKSTYHEGFVR